MNNKTAFQFLIKLNDSEPKVWRRFWIDKNSNFYDLHCAIGDAMGWGDSHLHAFYILAKGLNKTIQLKVSDDFWEDYRDIHEEKTKLTDVFPKLCKQLTYTYDMGDSWDHTVLFEKEIETKEKLPKFIAGAGMCPYEDSGSNGGWEDKLRIQKNPKHPEYKWVREWLGLEKGEYIDPTEFDPKEVYFSNPKARYKEWKKQMKEYW